LPGESQQAHQLALPFLPPGVQLHLPPGIGQGSRELAAALVGGGQALQGVEDLAVQLLATSRDPLLKRGAIIDGQALQKGAAIERDRLAQALQAGVALIPWLVRVFEGGLQQGREVSHVHLVVRGRVELNGVRRHHKGGDRRRIAGRGQAAGPTRPARAPVLSQGTAQVIERLAEVGPGRRFGALRPQEGGQRLSPVWAAGLHRQIGQQGACLVRLETGHRSPVQPYSKPAE